MKLETCWTEDGLEAQGAGGVGVVGSEGLRLDCGVRVKEPDERRCEDEVEVDAEDGGGGRREAEELGRDSFLYNAYWEACSSQSTVSQRTRPDLPMPLGSCLMSSFVGSR